MPDLVLSVFVPQNLIVEWSGLLANIPEGWVLCDGTNSTPNLIARFVRGAPVGQDSGATGGGDSISLTTVELPSHDHSFSETTHSHSSPSRPPIVSVDAFSVNWQTNQEIFDIGFSTSSITIENTGSGTGHENRPPFFELAYIMKT